MAFGKNGLITFNDPACKLAGIKSGDKVTIAQDGDKPENWYFFKDPQHGFEVRSGYKERGALFNHIALCKAFLEAMEKDAGKTHSFRIGGQPSTINGDKTKYWGILIN